MRKITYVGNVILVLAVCHACWGRNLKDDSIRPWSENPRYWQYNGKPVMLLGGSKTDHIFLLDDLKTHLDEIHAVGANYVRCTMSQREGLDLKPHRRRDDGKFDLNEWNEDYWTRFENCLKWCDERDIIMQIEVWDRFDYVRTRATDTWKISPWRPANNVNYTREESGFQETYKDHPARDKQPFFHSVPGLKQYRKKYDLIRGFQEKFIDKMLSYSLKHGNVLYCMDNETNESPNWGAYWSGHIRKKASEAGVEVHTTEMWDAHDLLHEHHKRTYDHPKTYTFCDSSQNNSNPARKHWDNIAGIFLNIN